MDGMRNDANTKVFKRLNFFISGIRCLLVISINADCRILFQSAFHFETFGEDVQVGDIDLLENGLHLFDLSKM